MEYGRNANLWSQVHVRYVMNSGLRTNYLVGQMMPTFEVDACPVPSIVENQVTKPINWRAYTKVILPTAGKIPNEVVWVKIVQGSRHSGVGVITSPVRHYSRAKFGDVVRFHKGTAERFPSLKAITRKPNMASKLRELAMGELKLQMTQNQISG